MLLDLVPEGFEELDAEPAVELVAFVSAERERALLEAFPGARSDPVEPGWEHRWREFHHGVEIGPLWVGPPWEQPPPGRIAIVIDPGLAFGTGAHPTTRLCLELLAARPAGAVADLGCGSGVLAIAAAKLGHAPVLAVDSDEQAVAVARENAAHNGAAIDARVADAREVVTAGTDLAVANIALDVISAIAPSLRAAAVITSGYLAGDALVLPGYAHVERRTLDGWAADLYARQ